MADPITFAAVPASGPVLVPGRTSSLALEFGIPTEVFTPIPPASTPSRTVFLRFVALWRDSQPLGCEAPTFEIGAGGGRPSSVTTESENVAVLDIDDRPVGVASCARQEDDIFLITISQLVQNAEPWSVLVRNNDSKSLTFLGFRSSSEAGTMQPWMKLGGTEIALHSAQAKELQVRNWGTADLIFTDRVGQAIRGTNSLVIMKSRPESVKPHGVDRLTLESVELTSLDTPPSNLTVSIGSNDPDPAHGTLPLTLIPPDAPGEPMYCRECDCEGYVGPGANHPCRRPGCGHTFFFHLDPKDRPNPSFPP